MSLLYTFTFTALALISAIFGLAELTHIYPSLSNYLNYEILSAGKITELASIFGILFGLVNLWLIKRSSQDNKEERLFNIATKNLEGAISLIENLNLNNKNDRFTWSVTAAQLSAFHNLAIQITDKSLRQAYCAKLHEYSMRIANQVTSINNFLFYYGIHNFEASTPDDIRRESLDNFTNISVNDLNCLLQFIFIFDGAKGDYMTNDSELSKILRPIVCGFWPDEEMPNEEQVQRICNSGIRNVYLYMHDLSRSIPRFRNIHPQ